TLVNLTISTVGVSPGSYPFLLTGTQIGLPSEFIGGGLGDYVTTAVTNGTINVSSTPEPSTLLLAALGGAGILLRRRRIA
ncbi:MAG TPA: PEP-CTERM sorting domain-containing protein, partial [Tepidisphaeraceae bacterium]|nr:PEP-CTERM sorting domain-containing protein [Tepidisphaeraceae bacterium]